MVPAASDSAYPPPRPGQPVTPTCEFCPLKKEQESDASRDAVAEQQALFEGIQAPVSGFMRTLLRFSLAHVRYLMYT